MSILIIGGNGNMGRRYQKIFKFMEKECAVLDLDWTDRELDQMVKKAEGFIIATPTDTHTEWIQRLCVYQRPILCEKPISKNLPALKETFQMLKDEGCKLNMVYQYKFLTDSVSSEGLTQYDYWNHGKDGLAWDCIQIIGLAKGRVSLKEDSPIWKCWINGDMIDLRQMDLAYIKMMRAWFRSPGQSLNEILDIHEKTELYQRMH